MAKTVAEIMDRHFVYASQADSIPGLLRRMAGACIASVPVLDLAGRPVGKATVCDIETCHHVEDITAGRIGALVSVSQNTSVDAAARTLAQGNADSLVVVDEQGIAVGLVNAAELLRAVLGFACSQRDDVPLSRRGGRWNDGLLELDAG